MTSPCKTLAALASALFLLTACDTPSTGDKADPLAGDVIDEADLTNLMLTTADANQAVRYFEQAVAREPEREDFRRGLARSYTRANRLPEAARIYQELVALRQDTNVDRMEYAYVALRLDRWDDASALASRLPPDFDLPRRHVLDAILADKRKDWEAADRAYQRAEALSPNPAEVLNNWGVSQMGRGEFETAEKTFQKAVSFDSRLFSAKNNLAISRGMRGNYRLPVVPLTDTERAKILYNLGVIAQQKGERRAARGLYAAAVDAHPQYYQAAADRLASLDSAIIN